MFEEHPLGSLNPELPVCDLSSSDPSVDESSFNKVVTPEIQSLLLLPAPTKLTSERRRRLSQLSTRVEVSASPRSTSSSLREARSRRPLAAGALPSRRQLHHAVARLQTLRPRGAEPQSRLQDLRLLEPELGGKLRRARGRDRCEEALHPVVSPGNPNCVHCDYPVMQQFLDLAAKYGLAIFSDEIYLKMCHDKREHVSPVQLASDA